MSEEDSKLVYSTERPVSRKSGKVKNTVAAHGPEKKSALKVRVRLERKGRGGKSVTVIDGIQETEKDLEALLKRIKSGLGTGGTVRGGCLEIQGDRCAQVIKMLEEMGYRPKRSGGR